MSRVRSARKLVEVMMIPAKFAHIELSLAEEKTRKTEKLFRNRLPQRAKLQALGKKQEIAALVISSEEPE